MKNIVRTPAALLAVLLAACGGEPATQADALTAAAEEAAAAAPEAPAGARRYDVRSGIMESTTDVMEMPQTATTYFDDYGAREATYRTTKAFGQQTESVEIRADGWLTTYDPATGVGTRTRTSNANPTADIATASPEQVRRYKIRETGTRTLVGQEARGYAAEIGGGPMQVWIWKKIPLLMEMQMGGAPMTTTVTSLQTDVPVPAEKFEIPAHVTITEH